MIELDRTFLGRLSEQLSELIEQQSAEVFKRAGIVIPVKSSSLLGAIATLGPVSVADLVRALDRSHQLIQQKIPKLLALDLVSRRPDPNDLRINLIEITDRGREQLALLDRLTPAHFETPLGRRVPIDYDGETPGIELRLQELFGVTTHPTVGPKRLPLRITLLSPGGKPVQVTADLPGFWTNSYADVRRDMRGRYPRHPWPEDPREADPTTRTKPRGT